MNVSVPLREVVDRVRAIPFNEQGKKRQAAVWRGEEPDYLPLILAGNRLPERGRFPVFSMREQFHEKEKMLYEILWNLLALLETGSDAVASIRPNLGVGFLASVFGLQQTILENAMPWPQETLSRERIRSLRTADLDFDGPKSLLPKAREIFSFYRDVLPEIPLYIPDTQGPFDLAHLVRGHDIFTDIYDDTDFFLHLMDLATYVYVEGSRRMKEAVGEPMDSGHHNGDLYMAGCGVRSCEDTTTLLSPPSIRNLIVPSLRKALQPFSGGWVHVCGKTEHFNRLLLDLPEVKGFNLGNPESHDMGALLADIGKRGKVYFGPVPARAGEPLEDYFLRILRSLGKKGGLILSMQVTSDQEPRRILDLWHAAQDRVFS